MSGFCTDCLQSGFSCFGHMGGFLTPPEHHAVVKMLFIVSEYGPGMHWKVRQQINPEQM